LAAFIPSVLDHSVVRKLSRGLFLLLFPDECKICSRPLDEVSRVPVCRACLRTPEPLAADYFCASCRTPFQNHFALDEEGRCALCRLGLRGFDYAYSFGAYEGTLRQLIHLYKYGRVKPLARPLSDLLATALPRDQRFDAVVAVPLHWRRRAARGFNQSELLAKSMAQRCGIPVMRPVRRQRATQVQAGLSNTNRRRNVAGAFTAKAGAVNGLRILLVDDVMTTGATASACAQALKRAGARSVSLLTLARVDRRFVNVEGDFRRTGAS
jgi:ComF family protein